MTAAIDFAERIAEYETALLDEGYSDPLCAKILIAIAPQLVQIPPVVMQWNTATTEDTVKAVVNHVKNYKRRTHQSPL